MSKKFFSLIQGNSQLNAAPGVKIIPAKDFSKLLEARGVMTAVQKDATQYRIAIAKECEQLKEQAQKEGFEEGFKKWAGHLAELETEIRRVHEELQKVIAPLALKAAKKIVGREIELSPTATVDIIANSLKTVAQHKKIVVYVNKKDYDILDKNKEKLKQLFETLEAFSLRERADILPGGCIIETEGGIINAQIANKWHALEQAFATFLK